jgi:FkbM family methyltransferase
MVKEVGRSRAFPDGYIYPYHVWDFARPSFFCPLDLERVGTIGDGGKVVCGMTLYDSQSSSTNSGLKSAGNDTDANNNLVVYSFGVSGDSAFEAALLERTNAQIWGYDYSVDSWADQIHDEWLPRARFNRIGISGQTNLEAQPPMSTIQDLMRANGHTYIDIMKMDIEGAEFDALSSLAEYTKEQAKRNNEATPLLPIGQLLLEIHFMQPPKGFSIPSDLTTWLEWWSSLEELGLRAVNNEDNWIGNVRFGKPRFMEYTMVNALDQRNKLFFS